jgi:hypothetical protein
MQVKGLSCKIMPLPTFIIPGERRSGTTFLAAKLAQHPQLFLHPKRDSGWFVDERVRLGRGHERDDWEATHSPQSYEDWFEQAGVADEKQVGEKSADYLYYRPCHARIAEYLPQALHIVTLRNPIDRAWSHYWNDYGKGRETLSFSEAIAAEADRLKTDPHLGYHLSYTTRGFYDESLDHYFQHIDRERVLIVTLDEMKRESASSLQRICEFLGIDPSFEFPEASTSRNSNWTMVPKAWARSGPPAGVARLYGAVANAAVNLLTRDRATRRRIKMRAKSLMFEPAGHQTMGQEDRAQLAELYAPHIRRLEELLGRSFESWKQ